MQAKLNFSEMVHKDWAGRNQNTAAWLEAMSHPQEIKPDMSPCRLQPDRRENIKGFFPLGMCWVNMNN